MARVRVENLLRATPNVPHISKSREKMGTIGYALEEVDDINIKLNALLRKMKEHNFIG